MNSLLAVAATLLVAAITPGPNNLIVMRAAARGSFAYALPSVIGIVLGSVALLGVVVAGAGAAFTAWPVLGSFIGMGGALYLAWLGLRLIRSTRSDFAAPNLPAGVAGLLAFQFLNPKAWVMVLTVVATGQTSSAQETFLRLAPLFACIPAACLLLWAALGRALSRYLSRRAVRRWIDRTLGALLTMSSLLLLI